MIIIKDSMILIHLAKLSLLEHSCRHFEKVFVPDLVRKEIMEGKEKKFPDAQIIMSQIESGRIKVEKIKNRKLIKRANDFNIQGGEAEAVALYWEKKAELLATDDDNVRKKRVLLDLRLIGTPGIIINLYKKKKIDWIKFEESVSELRKIGWFNSAVLDTMILEAKK